MRKLSAFFLVTATVASATVATQACSSDGGAADLGDQDASVEDATVDAPPADQPDAVVTQDARPSPQKPTDGGIDLDALGPDEYALQINECAAFAACGGAVANKSFKYTGGCFDADGLETWIATTAGCDIEVSNARAVVKGTLEFSAENQFSRDQQLRVSADVLVPGSCGFLLIGGCDSLGDSAAGFGFTGLQCYDEVGGDGCDCLLNTSQQQEAAGTYSITGGSGDAGGDTLVVPGPDGGATTAPYCIDETTLRHIDRAAKPSPGDPGSYITWKLDEQPL